MKRLFFALIACTAIICAVPSLVSAAPNIEAKNKGLYISPLRNYLSLDAGSNVTRSFTVANLTDTPMTINAHVEQFSVQDYSYDFTFSDLKNDWVKLAEDSVTLKPYESHEIAYRISLPASASPGGYYYTLFASSTIQSGATKSTIQAATLLYLTVSGDLSYKIEVSDDSFSPLVTSSEIPYSIKLKNTGNTHYFALTSAKVTGLFYENAPNGTSQLLMPGTPRTVSNLIPAPTLPGIYQITYTVDPDHGESFTKTHYFLYMPFWSLVALTVAASAIIWASKKKRFST